MRFRQSLTLALQVCFLGLASKLNAQRVFHEVRYKLLEGSFLNESGNPPDVPCFGGLREVPLEGTMLYVFDGSLRGSRGDFVEFSARGSVRGVTYSVTGPIGLPTGRGVRIEFGGLALDIVVEFFPMDTREFPILRSNFKSVNCVEGHLFIASMLAAPEDESLEFFIRGDVDGNGRRNIADAVALIRGWSGHPIGCADAADVDDDGRVSVADVLVLFRYLFGQEPSLPIPFRGCGFDEVDDELDCEEYPWTSC
jgi:hypothetical protein